MPAIEHDTPDNEPAPTRQVDRGPAESPADRYRRLAQLCGVGAIVIGLSGLLGWLFDLSALNSILPGYKPIAISMALIAILLGGVQVQVARPVLPSRTRLTLLIVTLLITVFGALETVQLLTGIDVTFEHVMLQRFPTLNANPDAHISPVAGVLSLLAGVTYALLLYCGLRRRHAGAMADLTGFLGSLMCLGSSVFFLSYLYGTPLLYGGAFLPIAWLATMVFMLLGLGVMTSNGVDAFPLCHFAGTSTRARLLRAFLPLTALVLSLSNAAQYFFTELTSINPAVSAAILTMLSVTVVWIVVLQVARIMGDLLDRTERERQRAVEEFRISEHDLNRAQAVAKIGSWRLDVRHNELRWSDETYRLFGIPAGTPMTYDTFLAAILPEDRAYVDRKWTAALQGDAYDIEHRIRVDDTVKWVRERAELDFDDAGNLLGGFGTVQDITEQKQAEAERRLLSEALASAANGVVITDRQGRISWINPAFTRLTGYSLEEARGQNPHILNAGQQPHAFFEDMWATIESGRSWHGQLINRRKDGALYHEEMTITPVRAGGGEITHFVAIKEDITERKRAEQERERLLNELRQLTETLEQRVHARTAALEAANKELEAFSYSVSHDLRSPLRSIDGFSKILLERYRDHLDPQGQDYLTRVRAATLRMGRLIDDMLNLSRIGRAQMRRDTVNLSEVAGAVMQDLRQRDPERRVTVDIQPDVQATGDAALLHIVFTNLLGNAWKFTGKREDARIAFGTMEQDGERVYYVRDNGAGFDMSYADKLFTPFQRLHTEEEFPGTGIGLAIVQRIIARHGGRVWAEGEEGKGATIYFTLGAE